MREVKVGDRVTLRLTYPTGRQHTDRDIEAIVLRPWKDGLLLSVAGGTVAIGPDFSRASFVKPKDVKEVA